MRGRRAFIVLTRLPGLLALITYGVYVVVAPSARADHRQGGFGFGGGQANASALIGQSIFTLLSIFQLILVSLHRSRVHGRARSAWSARSRRSTS